MRPDILRQRIREIPGFPFDHDSIQIEAEALENVLASMNQRKNPSSWVAAERVDFSDLPSERTAALLLSFPFREKTVDVIWPDLHAGIVLPFEDFVRFFDDLWFPSSYDAIVIDPRRENLLEISHEEIFTLFHRKQIAGTSLNLNPDTPQECFDLARRYDNGTGINQDKEAAVHWYRRAAELGHAEAQVEMGWRLFRGMITPRDDAEMVRHYRAAADQGNSKAIGELGRCYILGRGVPKDVVEAARLYRIAAEGGYVTAAEMLARCYRLGTGVEQNKVEADKWFAYANEMEAAQIFSAYLKYAELSGPPAAKAMRFIGRCCAYGYGTQQDFEQAKIWYLKAADEDCGNAESALFNVAILYVPEWGEIDTGDFRNLEEGIKYLRLAAEKGSWEAQLRLGCCYADGFGILQNDEEAMRLFRVVAEENVPEAMFRLGLCYHDGKGVLRDDEEARHWIQKAAEYGTGYAEAIEWLKQKVLYKENS